MIVYGVTGKLSLDEILKKRPIAEMNNMSVTSFKVEVVAPQNSIEVYTYYEYVCINQSTLLLSTLGYALILSFGA